MANGRIAARKQVSATNTLPEIGKIKIGEKAKNASGKEYPKSLDYFRATGNFAKSFTDINGDKPAMIPICFVSDNLEEVCNERYECWEGGKRWGFGDGTTFTVWNKDKGAYEENATKDHPLVKSLKWDQMLTLRFVVLNMPGILGYWSFTTKGKAVTIPSVVKAFDFVRERAQTIIGFPFNLMVEKKVGYNPGEVRNYPVVTLVPNFSQDAIDMVSNYLDQGGNINKITTAMIEQKKVLQIDVPKQEGQ